MQQLLMPYSKGTLTLKNHLVMAPMTRSRAINNIPNELMKQYYTQRAGAGLIITEGTAPAPEALGYPRIPGIFNRAQMEGWKQITDAIHGWGSKIFLQLMHTGRIGHPDNLPQGAKLVGVSGIKAAGQIFTDTKGMQDHGEPAALTTAGVQQVIDEHVTAAKNAMEAGFDGIELHGANGYLIEQFLNPHVNNRTDAYGGSLEGRAKIIVELLTKIAAAIGKEKVGIRFSPYSTLGDLAPYAPEVVHAVYAYLAGELNRIGIAYIHIGASAPAAAETIKAMRTHYAGTLILCNGFTPETAAAELGKNVADLVALGRTFLANPDLDKRISAGALLNQPDYTTLYTPGAKGYTDYPVMNREQRTPITLPIPVYNPM